MSQGPKQREWSCSGQTLKWSLITSPVVDTLYNLFLVSVLHKTHDFLLNKQNTSAGWEATSVLLADALLCWL